MEGDFINFGLKPKKNSINAPTVPPQGNWLGTTADQTKILRPGIELNAGQRACLLTENN